MNQPQKDQMLHITLMDGMVRGLLLTATNTVAKAAAIHCTSPVATAALGRTLMGTAIDIEKRRRMLSIGTGGLSGPCVKPVALRMVYQVAKAVNIPVIGLGGISSATDAIEFIMAGASAIEIGTANFLDPAISAKVAQGINEWLDAHNIASVKDIVGVAE